MVILLGQSVHSLGEFVGFTKVCFSLTIKILENNKLNVLLFDIQISFSIILRVIYLKK